MVGTAVATGSGKNALALEAGSRGRSGCQTVAAPSKSAGRTAGIGAPLHEQRSFMLGRVASEGHVTKNKRLPWQRDHAEKKKIASGAVREMTARLREAWPELVEPETS